ncbi:MAG: caspase family protein [Bacteroidales bacterium]|nr:caspase family protein [Bacteroidales bacterium]
MQLIFLAAVLSPAQTRRALIIGVGEYPEYSGWRQINGDKDIPIVRDMLLYLGFPENNIDVLKNQHATCSNILNAFDRICNRSAKGDVVYIHFSGHGQMITDVHNDENDGFDEAIVPVDAYRQYRQGIYHGENHIIDDVINQYLSRLKRKVGKSGMVLFIVDACHSGDISRGDDEDDVARGTSDRFILNVDKAEKLPSIESTQWINISACKSYQTNYEYKTPDGHYVGKLTYFISEAYRRLDRPAVSQVFDYVKERMAEVSRYPQEPQLDLPDHYKRYKL